MRTIWKVSVYLHARLQTKERNNKGSEQAQLTNVQNQIWLDPTTYRNQNQAKNFFKTQNFGLGLKSKNVPYPKKVTLDQKKFF